MGRSWYIPIFVMMVCPVSTSFVWWPLTLYNTDISGAMYLFGSWNNGLAFEYTIPCNFSHPASVNSLAAYSEARYGLQT
jgi:hypothetical protein